MATPRKLKDYKKLNDNTRAIMLMLEGAKKVIDLIHNGQQEIVFTKANHNVIKQKIIIEYNLKRKSDGT